MTLFWQLRSQPTQICRIRIVGFPSSYLFLFLSFQSFVSFFYRHENRKSPGYVVSYAFSPFARASDATCSVLFPCLVQDSASAQRNQDGHTDANVQNDIRLRLVRIESRRGLRHEPSLHGVGNSGFHGRRIDLRGKRKSEVSRGETTRLQWCLHESSEINKLALFEHIPHRHRMFHRPKF
jgi:hypothetical protein